MKTRYAIFSKKSFGKSGKIHALKNCRIREDAREFKREKRDGRIFGIYDRHRNIVVR